MKQLNCLHPKCTCKTAFCSRKYLHFSPNPKCSPPHKNNPNILRSQGTSLARLHQSKKKNGPRNCDDGSNAANHDRFERGNPGKPGTGGSSAQRVTKATRPFSGHGCYYTRDTKNTSTGSQCPGPGGPRREGKFCQT